MKMLLHLQHAGCGRLEEHMSIDERLEALSQTVELMAHMQQENDKIYEKRFAQIAHTFELALDSIQRLENIAVAHGPRLDDVEGH